MTTSLTQNVCLVLGQLDYFGLDSMVLMCIEGEEQRNMKAFVLKRLSHINCIHALYFVCLFVCCTMCEVLV